MVLITQIPGKGVGQEHFAGRNFAISTCVGQKDSRHILICPLSQSRLKT